MSDKLFMDALEGRIEVVRATVSDLPKTARRGYRFKNDKFVATLTMRLHVQSKDILSSDFIIQQRLRGLDADKLVGTTEEIYAGKFDRLVEKALTQAAEYDYLAEGNLGVH